MDTPNREAHFAPHEEVDAVEMYEADETAEGVEPRIDAYANDTHRRLESLLQQAA